MWLITANSARGNATGGQYILRERHNTHSVIYLQEQKHMFSGVNCIFLLFFIYLFIFVGACFATKLQMAYVAH